MGFFMISGTISIVIAVAFIVICLATVKHFAEKENNSHNDESYNDQRDILTMAATGLLIQEALNNDSNINLSDCGSCSSDCNHTDCNSIDSGSSNFDSSDFSSSSDISGGSDFGGSCDF